MRRLLRILLVCAVLVAGLCMAAYAGSNAGICGAQSLVDGVSISAQTASGTVVSPVNGVTVGGKTVNAFCANAVKLHLTYSNSGANGNYYMIFAVEGDGAPTEQNLVYIDQAAANSSGADFTVYPSRLSSGTTYSLYMTTNNASDSTITGYKKVGQYSYAADGADFDIAVNVRATVPGTMTATLTNQNDSSAVYSGRVTGGQTATDVTVSFSTIPDGTYTLLVKKTGKYAPRSETLIVSGGVASISSLNLVLYGDAVVSGDIDVSDIQQIARHTAGYNTPNAFGDANNPDPYIVFVANITRASTHQDTDSLDITDIQQIARYMAGYNSNYFNAME